MATPPKDAFEEVYGSPEPDAFEQVYGKPEKDEGDLAFEAVYGKRSPHVDIAARQQRRVIQALPGAKVRGRMMEELGKPSSTPAATRSNLATMERIAAEPKALKSRVGSLMDMSAVRTGGISEDAAGGLFDLAEKEKAEVAAEPPSLIRDLKKRAGQGIFGKLDVLFGGELARQLLTPGYEVGSGPLDVDKSIELYRQAAAKDDAQSYLYKPYVAANEAVGKGLGRIINAPVEAYDLGKRVFGQPTDPELMRQMREGSQAAGREIVHGSVLDPSNLLSFGAMSGGKAAFNTTLRSLSAAGVADDTAKALAKEVGAAVSAHGSSPRGVEAVERILKKAELPDAAKATVRDNVIGREGELLEAGGLRVSVPFLPEYGFDVAALGLGHTERLGAKAIRGVGDVLDAAAETKPIKPGMVRDAAQGATELAAVAYNKIFPWLKPAKEQGASAAAMGRAFERALGDSGVERFTEVMREAPVDVKRQEEILRNFVDPEHTVPVEVGSAEYAQLVEANGPAPVQFKRNTEDGLKDFAVWGSVIDDLTPQEKKWVDSLQGFFDDYHKRLVSQGLLKEEQYGRNLLTGRYVPRILDEVASDDAAELAKKIRQGGGYTPTASRNAETGGTPLGMNGSYSALLADPTKIGTKYIRAVSNIQARRAAQDALEIAYPKGVPKLAQDMVDASFDKSSASMSQLLRKNHPRVSRWVAAYERAVLGTFKKNVLVRTPGYHWMNFAEDMSKMFADGVSDPLIFEDALRALKGSGTIELGGKQIAAKEFMREAREQGFGWGKMSALDPFDESPAAKIREATKAGARARGEKIPLSDQAVTAARGAWKAADTATFGPAGIAIAKTWDDMSKTALYLHHRRAGMSPARAAARVREVLLDYGDLTNPVVGAARTFMPFAQWALKMPLGAAKMTMRQPGRVSAVGRIQEALGGKETQEDVYQAPAYERERGRTHVPGPGGQAFANMALEGLTGKRMAENERAYVNFRNPWSETSSLVGRAIRSPRSFGETVVSQLDPILMGAGEMMLDQDVRNLRPLGQALDPRTVDAVRGSPLNPGRLLDAAFQDPLDPDESARGVARSVAHAQRNLPTLVPIAGSPMVLQGINQLLHDETDPGSPLNTLGMYRPAQDIPQEHARALQWARILSRWGIGITGPDEPWRDYLRNAERLELEQVTNPQTRQAERAYPYPSR